MNHKKLIQQLLQKVKQNRKYSSISDGIIKKEIESYLKSNPKTTRIIKQDIKKIRAKLHRLYSTYQTKKKKKRELYLEELKQNPSNKEATNRLLSLVLSTSERLSDYKLIYNKIFKITGKPKTILDLGAGFNPLSFHYMNLNKLTYYAYDIDTQDIKFLNNYFKIMKKQGLDGKAKILDIRNQNKLKQLPNSNIIFIFKLIDLLSTKETEQIIKLLINRTQYIIASFATKTITRRQMNKPKRKWFEMMLQRNNLNFKTFKTENEIFYVINR